MKAPAQSKSGFAYLIAPHTATEFLERHWQQSALLIKGSEPDRFQSLIPGADIDAILAFAAGLPGDAVELVGKTTVSGSRARLDERFAAGSTVRIRGIQQHLASLQELCRGIEQQLGFPTRANLYCTPSASRGFALHFDTHEVLVLQLIGSKHWEVYEPGFKLPLKQVLLAAATGEVSQVRIDKAELGAQVIDNVLEPGDCLYLPRGFVHQAKSLDGPSVHLTVGIHVPVEGVAAATAERVTSQSAAASEADLQNLNNETRVIVNDELKLYLSADGKMAALAFGEKYFWMPMSFAPIMRFVAEQKEFVVSQLPGNLGEHGKLVFARELLQRGFLRIGDGPQITQITQTRKQEE